MGGGQGGTVEQRRAVAKQSVPEYALFRMREGIMCCSWGSGANKVLPLAGLPCLILIPRRLLPVFTPELFSGLPWSSAAGEFGNDFK